MTNSDILHDGCLTLVLQHIFHENSQGNYFVDSFTK